MKDGWRWGEKEKKKGNLFSQINSQEAWIIYQYKCRSSKLSVPSVCNCKPSTSQTEKIHCELSLSHLSPHNFISRTVRGVYRVSTVSHRGNFTYQRRVEGMTQPPGTVSFPPVCQLAAAWTGAPLTEPSLRSGHTLTSGMIEQAVSPSAADLQWHTHTWKSPERLLVEYPVDGSCDRLVTDRSGSSPPVG